MTTLRTLGRILLATLMAMFFVAASSQAADHRDGPIFANTVSPVSDNDINDLYLFQSPIDPSRTVLVMTWSPFTGSLLPATFDPAPSFDIRVDNDGDAAEDLTFRVTFGPVEGNGSQNVTLRGLPVRKFPRGGVLAKGNTGENLEVAGGGSFRADVFDDPFFFDAAAVGAFLRDGNAPVPRAVAPRNFFKNANTLAFVIEIPTVRLLSSPDDPLIGVYLHDQVKGVTIDRTGQPAINTGLIPPVPRVDLSRGDRRNAFNNGLPVNDVRDFRDDAIFVLSNTNPRSLYQRDPATAAALTDFLLPDLLKYDTSKPASYPNGRTLRDDVIDTTLQILTGAAGLTDGVADDNGDLITDGTTRPDGSTRPAIFPYLGVANVPAGLPNP
jgi:hypothetical protein